jgi:hypothetical protein
VLVSVTCVGECAAEVIKLTSCLPMVSGSLWVLKASSTTKTGRHNIAEILVKVALKD